MFSKFRQEIDQIDQELVGLFERRLRVVQEIAAIKQANDLDILDESRESQVIEKTKFYLKNPEYSPLLEELYQEIMRLSRKHQVTWLNQHQE